MSLEGVLPKESATKDAKSRLVNPHIHTSTMGFLHDSMMPHARICQDLWLAPEIFFVTVRSSVLIL